LPSPLGIYFQQPCGDQLPEIRSDRATDFGDFLHIARTVTINLLLLPYLKASRDNIAASEAFFLPSNMAWLVCRTGWRVLTIETRITSSVRPFGL
jgi:hypothetical protein